MLGGAADSLEVKRLQIVRCPQCRNLLPELAVLSIYQCGACNTTLQVKHSAYMGSSSGKSNSERMLNPEVPRIRKAKEGSQNDRSDVIANGAVLIENLNSKSTELNDHAINGAVISENAIVPAGIFRDSGSHSDSRDERNYQRAAKKEVACAESQSTYRDIEDNHSYKSPFGDPSVAKGKAKADYQMEDTERKYSNMDEIGDDPPRPRRLTQAPATYQPSCSYDACEYQDEDFPDSVEHLDQYEAEMLRKIDELRDQLIQTHVNRPTRGRGVYSENLYETSDLSPSYTESGYLPNPPSFQHFPSPNAHNMSMSRYHQMVPDREELFGYDIPQALSPFCRAPFDPPSMCDTHRYGRFDLVPATSHVHDLLPPTFSRTNHYGYHRNMAENHPHIDSGIMKSLYRGGTRGLHPMDSGNFRGTGSHKFKSISSLQHSRGLQDHHKPIFNVPDRHKCQSVAGGAPYISCDSCLKLLVLPCGLLRNGDRAKLRCGECSQIFMIEINGGQLRIVESVPTDGMEDGLKQQAPMNSVKRDTSSKSISSAIENTAVSKPAFTDGKESSVKGHSPKLSEMDNRERTSSSQGTSKEGSPKVQPYHQDNNGESGDITRRRPNVNSRAHDSPPASDSAGSSDHLGSSYGVIKYVFGNMAVPSEPRSVVTADDKHQRIPTQNTELATELELSPSEYQKLDLSLESRNGKKDGAGLGGAMSNGPFFIGLENRDQPQFNQSPHNERCRVSINGHPISDQVVMEAVKKAGPIQPGDYWYDYNAGFWGLMGQPCLGIIPPFIEEFNFIMPKNCAGGDTGVVVNGRELHQKDLDLLASRCLPSTRGKSYAIEISGRVEDVESGEELGSLGKLAPTIEKLGYGFGMRPPRVKR